MSKQSSSTANAKPNLALEDEIVIPVSDPIGLTELATSLEALNLKAKQNTAIVHRTQTSSPARVREVSRSPDKKDQKKASPVQGHKPRRYALQMWLEVEVDPGLFVPPQDNSFSVDYAMEAINRAYPGCTGIYLDRDGHMLAFNGRKGSTRAGLTQDVAVEVCWAVSQLPTWMGYTAKWKVRCVSLAEANDILVGCKRLEKENRR